jgi:hypothetical protein
MPAIDIRSAIFIGLLVVMSWDGWDRWAHRARHPPAGQMAERDPVQTEALADTTVTRGRWTLKPRAHYDVTARVLSTERYRFDALAALAPEDLALGWGPMSDNTVLDTMDISQSGRFYWWRPHADTPVPPDTIITHSANTHVIPADDRIRKELGRLRVGEVVRLTGTLVDANRDDGAEHHDSCRRHDTQFRLHDGSAGRGAAGAARPRQDFRLRRRLRNGWRGWLLSSMRMRVGG